MGFLRLKSAERAEVLGAEAKRDMPNRLNGVEAYWRRQGLCEPVEVYLQHSCTKCDVVSRSWNGDKNRDEPF
jgi:hypothetical protein